MSSVAPAWAETSVRWLRSHHPELTPASSSKTFVELLGRALVKMKYFYKEMAEARKFTYAKWQSSVMQMPEGWTKANHEKMVKFLEAGGYIESVTVATVGPDGSITHEEVAIEMDELEDMIDHLPAPKAQLSPEHELEEVVAAAVLESDPRHGVW